MVSEYSILHYGSSVSSSLHIFYYIGEALEMNVMPAVNNPAQEQAYCPEMPTSEDAEQTTDPAIQANHNTGM